MRTERMCSTVDDVMVGLDDCGRSVFGVMESFGQSCFSWVSLLLADEISFYENLEAIFCLQPPMIFLAFGNIENVSRVCLQIVEDCVFLLVLLLP